jgi:hypothetical protein
MKKIRKAAFAQKNKTAFTRRVVKAESVLCSYYMGTASF